MNSGEANLKQIDVKTFYLLSMTFIKNRNTLSTLCMFHCFYLMLLYSF